MAKSLTNANCPFGALTFDNVELLSIGVEPDNIEFWAREIQFPDCQTTLMLREVLLHDILIDFRAMMLLSTFHTVLLQELASVRPETLQLPKERHHRAQTVHILRTDSLRVKVHHVVSDLPDFFEVMSERLLINLEAELGPHLGSG